MDYQQFLCNCEFLDSPGGPLLTNKLLSICPLHSATINKRDVLPQPNFTGTELNSPVCIFHCVRPLFCNMEVVIKMRKGCCI